jgi:hypothetical protein
MPPAWIQVCKATAAAMLSPEATQQAVQRQAVLQPLKFAHFERRALHMATQLLECSRRWAWWWWYGANQCDKFTITEAVYICLAVTLPCLYVGLAKTIYICGVYTVVLAGKSPNIRSYTVYIYSSGQPYLYAFTDREERHRCLHAGANRRDAIWAGFTFESFANCIFLTSLPHPI